ncbi:MAG TPA: GyrI-like domain-containing protein [Puia sp.]|nr:GyrI-like domain-containing protein [Puia sp.]
MTPLSISIRKDFSVSLYGFSGVATLQDWAGTGRTLMDRLWKEVRSKHLPNNGLNVWVYDEDNKLFTGVELTASPPADSPLEHKTVFMPQYAYTKHIGPYDQLKSTHEAAREEFKRVGIRVRLPYIEIYGHWTEDPAKLETELLWSII